MRSSRDVTKNISQPALRNDSEADLIGYDRTRGTPESVDELIVLEEYIYDPDNF